jgi:hypothetical protein
VGGFYRRGVVFGCGVAVMEQVTRGSRCDMRGVWHCWMMAAAGALQRGCGAAVVRMEAGTHAGGIGEWWGQ